METARVDLRKLQLLNDRIAQVIEALNQVRFSVHGLQHTAGFTQGIGAVPGYSPWAFNAVTGQVPVMGGVAGLNGLNGLSHTAADVGVVDPIVAQQMAARFGQPVPVGAAFPYAQAVQYAQTFPWAYVPVAPVPGI